MLGATIKALFAHKFRLLLSTVSILLGVAFITGSLMFTHLLQRSFDEIVHSTLGDINVSAIGADPGATPLVSGKLLTPEDLARIADVPGIAGSAGIVTSNQVRLLDTDERIVAVQGAPGIGSNWHEVPAAGGIPGPKVVQGRAPARAGEVVVDPNTARRSGHAIGDEVQVVTSLAGTARFTLVGIATYGSGVTAGASYLFFTTGDAQRLFIDGKDGYQGVWASLAPGQGQAEVKSAVARVLPEGWEVSTGDELAAQNKEQLDTQLGFINALLLVFAGIALLVAILLILNTFSILVAARARELALLRALGATRRQVRRAVLMETLVVGLLGSLLGIPAGYGLVWGLIAIISRTGVDLGGVRPQLTWLAVGAGLVVGVVVTVGAALVPAVRAARARPVEALSASAPGATDRAGSGFATAGIVLGEVAFALLACGVFLDVPSPVWWVGCGAALLLVGAVLAASWLGAPVLWLGAQVFGEAAGEVGHLAARNARRQPRRTAATAATMMIGLAVVTTVSVLATSITTSMRTELTRDQRGQFVVASVDRASVDARVADRIKDVDGVDWLAEFAPARVSLAAGRERVAVVGTTPQALLEGSATDIVAGTMTADSDTAVISTDFARRHQLSLGKTFTLAGELGSERLLVTGVADGVQGTEVFLQRATLERIIPVRQLRHIVVFTTPGADEGAVEEGLRKATAEYRLVSVTSVAQYVQEQVDQFRQLVTLVYALMALALVIALLGIVNTLSLSVIERTREIGLLRAVGVTRAQIRRMISLESVLITVTGALLGVGLGLLAGAALQHVNRDSGIEILDIPWLQLGVFVLVAAVFGWLAALAPARRAARMPVLTSIAAE